MNVKYDLVVDFARPNKSNTVIVSEGDSKSRVCHFTLLNNKYPMSMSDVTSATVRAVKSDGSVIWGEAEILVNDDGEQINEVEYTVPAAITDSSGNVTMTVTLMGELSEQLTSFEFYIQVRNALYNEDDLVSESDLSGFRDVLNRCLVAIAKIEAMTEHTALPNPYPLNINLEGDQISYSGNSTVTITLEDLAYISDAIDIVESVDESAAGSAAESADEAAQSASEAMGYADAASNSADSAEAYADQAREEVQKLALPENEGSYYLQAILIDGEMHYMWVPNMVVR